MDVRDTVLNLVSSQVFEPKESINVESTLASIGAKADVTEIKSKLDCHYKIHIPMEVMNGKLSGIITCIEKNKKKEIH